MKLLLFSDLHINKKLAKELVAKSSDVDVVIGAGDFAIVHRGLEETISILKEIEKPSLVVPGNGETTEELIEACRDWNNCQVLHGKGTKLSGIDFYGIGGGIPVTPFGSWSYDFTEKEAEELLKNCPENGVLISHSPPYQVLDKSSSGQHLGSTAVRNVIDHKTPKLLVCGHIHESGGRQHWVNNTLVVNAGPKGIIVSLDT